MREKLVKYRSHSGKKKKRTRRTYAINGSRRTFFSVFFLCVCQLPKGQEDRAAETGEEKKKR